MLLHFEYAPKLVFEKKKNRSIRNLKKCLCLYNFIIFAVENSYDIQHMRSALICTPIRDIF